MNILVTGGAGFIGSHACKYLAAAGCVPIAYDNLSGGHREAVKWGPLEVGDIGDTRRVRAVIDQYRPAALMHFAAYISVGESVRDPLAYYVNNVAGTAALLKTVVESGPIPVIFSSTAAVYGNPRTTPIPEDHELKPINPYGVTKMFVERMLEDAGAGYGLPWIAFRYFNAAGADPDGEIGEEHEPETHLIPLVLAAALNEGAINVFGTDYDTPDGSCIRDYIHVADIADAHILGLRYLLNGGRSQAMNLANSRGYSVKEVISAAEQVCGRSIASKEMPRREGDPSILIGLSGAARQLLGWNPVRSDLKCQIQHAWNWFSKNKR